MCVNIFVNTRTYVKTLMSHLRLLRMYPQSHTFNDGFTQMLSTLIHTRTYVKTLMSPLGLLRMYTQSHTFYTDIIYSHPHTHVCKDAGLGLLRMYPQSHTFNDGFTQT